MIPAIDNICPKCGGDVPNTEYKGQYPGALSRDGSNREICSNCGTREGLEAFLMSVDAREAGLI